MNVALTNGIAALQKLEETDRKSFAGCPRNSGIHRRIANRFSGISDAFEKIGQGAAELGNNLSFDLYPNGIMPRITAVLCHMQNALNQMEALKGTANFASGTLANNIRAITKSEGPGCQRHDGCCL